MLGAMRGAGVSVLEWPDCPACGVKWAKPSGMPDGRIYDMTMRSLVLSEDMEKFSAIRCDFCGAEFDL